MSTRDTHLRSLLSPSRSGTFFAPFRARSANPDGFDSKMKLWISAIEEWSVINKKLTFSLNDIHQIFLSDSNIRPDKECIRLVFSEMKRRSRIIPLNSIRSSEFWSRSANSQTLIDNFIDPTGWLGWGVKKFVYQPATWAVSAFNSSVAQDQVYSDLTDMSITDTMKFVCLRSLDELSQNLLTEFVRISKAEKQSCFEWQHLLELSMPIMNRIVVDVTNGKELIEMLDILIEHLANNKRVAIQLDNDSKLIKIISTDDIDGENVSITKKDIAMARLMRAKELLTADADKYHADAETARTQALECYKRKEVAKAKSLLRSHKRLCSCAEQKEAQLTNVEMLLDQLENTHSNKIILNAYRDGAEALKIANEKLEQNTTILDDMYDATAEAHHLNEEMNQMLNDISRIPGCMNDVTTSDLEAELNQYIAEGHGVKATSVEQKEDNVEEQSNVRHDESIDSLEEQLNNLVVCQDPIDQPERTAQENESQRESSLKKQVIVT